MNVLGLDDRPVEERFRKAFGQEEAKGLELAIRGRNIALAVIAVLIVFVNRFPDVLYYHAILAIFAFTGSGILWLQRQGRLNDRMLFAFVIVDFALVTFTLLVQNPFSSIQFPPQYVLRFGNIIYMFVIISGMAIIGRPSVLIAAGMAGATFWGIGCLWLMLLPDTVLFVPDGATHAETLAVVLEPHFVDPGVRLQEMVVFVVTAGLLAIVAYRSRHLTRNQVVAERARANLARYFAPQTAERLAGKDGFSLDYRRQDAAVMFSDIVSFTHWAEEKPPEEVISVLRDYHKIVADAVFAHGGTLDKYIGDGVMMTFGTPVSGERDASNAVSCLKAILHAVDEQNAKRAAQGGTPMDIVIGLHFGPVVFGDIGTDQRLELAALGDTVNLASRFERQTRKAGCRAVISQAVVDAVKSEPGGDDILAGFEPLGATEIRGRRTKVTLWGLSNS